MSLTIPEFVQFQAALFPLRGLWNAAPAEGDRFVNAEIDWGTPGLQGVTCVQFQLSGNSPVAFSQIVALSVDNSRCGGDVDFIFPDSGFVLTVPAFNQGIYPVFTNALMFYVSAPAATFGDITIAQILNSMPPPVAIQPSLEQSHAAVPALDLGTNATTVVVPAPVSGTLQGFALAISGDTTAAGVCTFKLIDGQGFVVYEQVITIPAGVYALPVTISGLKLRFFNGLSAQISGTTIISGEANVVVNVYYSLP